MLEKYIFRIASSMITDCMQFQNELFKIPFFDDDYFKTEGGHGGEQQAKSSNNTQLLAGLLCPPCLWAKEFGINKYIKHCGRRK